jgi:GNAT superfamily N-acetyltransferase
VLPPEVLDGLDAGAFAQAWDAAVRSRPDARWSVLVAMAGADIVGFAATGPAQGHPDVDPAETAELHALVVDPSATGAGHGSRLQAAVTDTAAAAGFSRLVTWVPDADAALRDYLVSSGWGADGAVRELDLRGDGAVLVRQTRLRTVLVPR